MYVKIYFVNIGIKKWNWRKTMAHLMRTNTVIWSTSDNLSKDWITKDHHFHHWHSSSFTFIPEIPKNFQVANVDSSKTGRYRKPLLHVSVSPHRQDCQMFAPISPFIQRSTGMTQMESTEPQWFSEVLDDTVNKPFILQKGNTGLEK